MLRSVLRRTNCLRFRNITSTSTCTFPITCHTLPCRNMSGLPPKPQTTIVNPWANVQVRERPVQTGPGVAHDMTGHILSVFETAKKSKRTVFVGYVTAGYPSVDESIDILLTMQQNGVDIIEVGVPFSDPLAEGPTIQRSNQRALENGVDSVDACLALVKRAREAGVTVPILFMGYYNPFRLYNTRGNLMRDAHEAGVSGFIIVDLPPEESDSFRQSCREEHLSFVPLITPTTTEERIAHLVSCADSFIYAVSLLGTTGARATISDELPGLIKKIKSRTSLPIAVGFGIGDAASYARVAAMSDGVVIGSAIINTLDKSPRETRMSDLAKWIRSVHNRQEKDVVLHVEPPLAKDAVKQEKVKATIQDSAYRFGDFGGRYVPETLVAALDELEVQYNRAKSDPTFFEEVRSYWDYIGRPSRLHEAQRLTQYAGGAKIYLKREDLNHTGAHKINNAVAQAILSKRLGKKRLIAETGAGQHGVATATICAKMGIPLTVYMGSEDVARQQLNVFRMKVMGATVVPVDSGSRTLKDAINEAMRDWVTNIRDTHYLIGSAIGPHPFPTIVRDFQSVIGSESREQILKLTGKLPDAVVACVGGGSNAIGMFYPFKDDKSVRLIGVEAGGEGLDTVNHSATLSAGTPGVLHGTRTYLLQDRQTGQISGTHSISAGLDYPGVGPEHAHLKDTQRAEYVVATDKQCLEGFSLLCRLEGIIPALESSHAIYAGIQLAKTMKPDQSIIICLSGRGDKDLDTVMRELPKYGF